MAAEAKILNDRADQSTDNGDVSPIFEQSGTSASTLLRDDFDRNVCCVMGLPVDVATIDTAIAAIDAAITSRTRLSFVTPNVNWLVRACNDPVARGEILAADLSLADGAPLAKMARSLGVPISGRVAGSDLFEALRRRPAFSSRKIKVFFFGGRDGAAEAAARALEEDDSAMSSAGWLNPGFGSVEEMSSPEIIEQINAAAPDFIVVALGAAKGQAWIDHNSDRLEAPVIAHLGAVVDFTAGGISRAPAWVGDAGLEWAWRIKEEPSLWKRYASDACALASLTVKRFLPTFSKLRQITSRGEGKISAFLNRDEVRVVLSGDIEASELAPVRQIFREASAVKKNVVLECDDLGRVDMSFLGLVLMLEKELGRTGKFILLSGASKAHKALFTANGMCYAEAVEQGNEIIDVDHPLAAAS